MHSEALQWSIHESRWDLDLDIALWFREYLSIKPARPEHMPGELVPTPGIRSADPSPLEFQQGWESWWSGLTLSPPIAEPGGPAGYARDEFVALSRWPTLRYAVLGNLPQANIWHNDRKSAAMEDWHPDMALLDIVKDIEVSMGRELAPFRLDLLLLPVPTSTIYEVMPGRFMLSESQRESFLLSDRFRNVIRTLGSS